MQRACLCGTCATAKHHLISCPKRSTWTQKKGGREGQPKEPHVLRGDSGKDPPPVKQKPRSQGIEVRDRWEGDPRESPGKGSWFVVVGCCFLLFVVVWCCLLLLFVVVWVYVCLCGCCCSCSCCSCYCSCCSSSCCCCSCSCCSCCCCCCCCCCVASSVAVALAQCCCCCLGGKHACWLLQVLLACCSLLLPAINQPPTRNQQPDIFSATHSKQQNTT